MCSFAMLIWALFHPPGERVFLVPSTAIAPAIILGATARRDIDRSNGRLTGRRLAATGIVTGLFGTGIGFVVLLWVMGAYFAPSTDQVTAETTRAMGASAEPRAAAPAPPRWSRQTTGAA